MVQILVLQAKQIQVKVSQNPIYPSVETTGVASQADRDKGCTKSHTSKCGELRAMYFILMNMHVPKPDMNYNLV